MGLVSLLLGRMETRMYRACRLAVLQLLLLLLAACSGVLVKEPEPPVVPEPVTFAGFAMLGGVDEGSGSRLEALFSAGRLQSFNSRFLTIQSPYFNLRSGLVDQGDGDSITLALALNRESLVEEQVGNKYKLLIRLNAQLLFFDFDDMRLLAAHPVTAACIDIQEKPFTRRQKIERIEMLLLHGLDGCTSLVERLQENLAVVAFKPSYGNYLQVAQVSVDATVAEKMSPMYRRNEDAKSHVAQVFSGSLSQHQHVPLLPYKVDRAIGNTMAGRFSNGNIFNLTIPEPDFTINVSLVDAGTGLFKRSEHERVDYYYVTASIKVQEPLTGKVYMDTNVRNVEVKSRPVNQVAGSHTGAYEQTMTLLFDEFSQVLTAPNGDWAKNFTGKSDNKKQLVAVRNIINSCK